MTPAAVAVDAALEAARFHTLLANERRYAAVRPFLRAVESARVPVLLLKGAVFAETLYADPGLRPFADVDILVRPDDLPAAQQALIACGYRPERADWVREEWEQDCQSAFVLPDALDTGVPLVVELHWNLINNDRLLGMARRIEGERLWARSVEARVAGQSVRALCPEHALLHLCLHLAGHGLDAPLSVRDSAALLAVTPVFDWEVFTNEARRFGLKTVAYAGLTLAAAARGAPVPEPVLRALRPGRIRRRRLDPWVTAAAHGESFPPAAVGRWLPLLQDTAGGAARVVAATLFPPPRWLGERYGGGSLWRQRLRHHAALARAMILGKTI